jgi:hypothetical protein
MFVTLIWFSLIAAPIPEIPAPTMTTSKCPGPIAPMFPLSVRFRR